MSVRLIAALFIAVAGLGACSLVQEKTFGESLDETSAATQIKTRLFAAGGTSHFGEVDVEVEDRFVLLSGRVPSEEDKREAERIAWSVRQVDEVANELVIERRNIGRDVNDVWIGQQVRARILADKHVKGVNYNIQVYDGVVYLLGLARSEDELKRAAEDASVVKGVAKVVSYVKMRERGQPPAYLAAPAPAPTAPAAPVGRPIAVDQSRDQARDQARDQSGDQSGGQLAGAPASAPVATPLAPARTDTGPSGAIQIAPPAAKAAPIVGPDRAPTTRAGYGDPYAPGATPPPGARSSSNSLQSAPLPPVQ